MIINCYGNGYLTIRKRFSQNYNMCYRRFIKKKMFSVFFFFDFTTRKKKLKLKKQFQFAN